MLCNPIPLAAAVGRHRTPRDSLRLGAFLSNNFSYCLIWITSEGTTQIVPNLDLFSNPIAMAAAMVGLYVK